MKKSYQHTSTSTNNHNNQFVQEIIHTITRHLLFILWSMSNAGALIGIPIGLLNPRTNHQPEVLRTAYFSPCFAMSMQFCSLFRNASPVFIILSYLFIVRHDLQVVHPCSSVFSLWHMSQNRVLQLMFTPKNEGIHHSSSSWSSLIIKYH